MKPVIIWKSRVYAARRTCRNASSHLRSADSGGRRVDGATVRESGNKLSRLATADGTDGHFPK